MFDSSISRPHPIRIVCVAFASVLFAGCSEADYRPEAIGPDTDIVVVMDDAHWNGPAGEAIRGTLADYVETLPAPEREFDLRRLDLATRFEEIRTFKNIVFAAPYTDTTAVGRFMQSRLPEEAVASEGGVAVHRENLWRRNQLVVYFTAHSPEELERTIRQEGQEALYLFNRITRERVTRDIFERGRQQDVEEQLMESHGFAVNVQHDFRVAVDSTNFIWLRRILSDSWRSIFIHYVENANPALLEPEWIYATRDSLTRRYIQGNVGGFVQMDRPPRRPLETELINFLGRYGFETRGLWQMVGDREDGGMVQFGMGGPFITYTFYDEPSGRIYMIDGMVFAPGYEKREFLRHMEAIAYTFRTREDEEQTASLRATTKRDDGTAAKNPGRWVVSASSTP